MKKLFTLLFLLISVLASAQKAEEKNFDNDRYIETQYYNMFTLRSGYSIFNSEHGKYGYNVNLEYNHYVFNNLYLLGSYVHAYSKNAEQYRSTEYTINGSIQEHILALGFGYDMLKINGHRIYGAFGVGAGYQSYTRDVVVPEVSFTTREVTEKGWSISYFPTGGYGYSVIPNLEVGASWAGYFAKYYWANSFNIHVGYKF